MKSATIRFFGPLNDLLPETKRYSPILHEFIGRPGIKDVIESYGIPRTEIFMIRVNENAVSFSYQLVNGDIVNIYPRIFDLNPATEEILQPDLPIDKRFLLDAHLGRLSRLLRMVGIDASYRNDADDADLAEKSGMEDRILLTRDKKLLMRNAVKYGYLVRSVQPIQQVSEIILRFDLEDQITPFTRCLECNDLLEPILKQTVLDQLAPNTRKSYNEFSICRSCERIYWKGSHYERMQQFIENLRKCIETKSWHGEAQ